MNKEIAAPSENSTISLIHALNDYSQKFDFKDSKRWALEWIKDNLPDEYSRLSDIKENRFSNRGFVCRMISRGFKFSDDQFDKLIAFFKDIKEDVIYSEEPENKPISRKNKINTVILQTEDVIDAILSDKEIPEVTIPLNKVELVEALSWLENEMIHVQEQIEKQTKILQQINSVYERCGGIKEKVLKPRKQRVVKSTKAKKIKDQAVLIKKINYKKKDETLNIESISPIKIVGAKELLVFNTDRNSARHFFAKPGETLTVRGSSIRNHDEVKSFRKTIRKPGDFFSNANLWKALDNLSTKSQKPSTLLSDHTLILAVK